MGNYFVRDIWRVCISIDSLILLEGMGYYRCGRVNILNLQVHLCTNRVNKTVDHS
jgi:hypothetical protein